MATAELTNEFKNVCASIALLASKKGELIRRPQQWGEITFEEVEQDIDTIFWLVEQTQELRIEIIPDQDLGQTCQNFQNILSILQEIANFSLSGDPTALRNKIQNRLKGELENALRTIGFWLPLLALHSGEIENFTARMNEINAETTATLQQTKQQVDTDLKEINEIKRAARTAAGEAGAAEFTEEFRTEATALENRGKAWLWPTTIFAGLALLLSFLIIFGVLDDAPMNAWEAVYRTGGRFIAIAVLFYAAAWSGRIVLANMHLASVNQHRAISLQTLQAFQKSAEDPVISDAVVLEAARAVYENVPSGYIARQASHHGGSARMLEIIKNSNRVPREGEG